MANEGGTCAGGWGLLTDLYELTMACGYWRHGIAEREAVFCLSFREHPFGGSYTIAAGLAHLCEMLREYRFSTTDIEYLASLRGADGDALFASEFLEYLSRLRFSCDIDAVEEGTLVFPHQPLARVRGPLLQAQIIESLLLNVINFQTLVATKAARVCRAAAPGAVLEFGLRRAQGESGAMVASRAAYIGGCTSTSNVLAGKQYGIPVRGTHAHSWVLSFETELEAFRKYAEAMPGNCILLVDTFDTHRGVAHAIQVAEEMRARGQKLIGIRLDSGDLTTLSRDARKMLDDAALHDVLIVASNDLDEYGIAALKEQGAQIDLWGVGTRLATAYDQPALGGVYKLSALRDLDGQWEYKFKISEKSVKRSMPGMLQIRRYWWDGCGVADVIYDELLGIEPRPRAVLNDTHHFDIPQQSTSEDLLVPVFRGGELVYEGPSIQEIRRRAGEQLDSFSAFVERGGRETPYRVGVESRLHERRQRLMEAWEASGR
ncbi:MAG: nicotinate phosphoribosyltransferase [Planctomycetota bacterium]